MRIIPNLTGKKPHWIVITILYAFKIIGLAPFSQQTKTAVQDSRRSHHTGTFRSSKIGLAYNFSVFILLQLVATCAYPKMSSAYYPNNSSLTRIMDLLLTFVNLFTSNVIIIYWALHQGKGASVINKFLEIDCVLSSLDKKPLSYKGIFTFLASHTISNFVIWISVFVSQIYLSPDSMIVALYYVTGAICVHFFIVEYFVAVRFLIEKHEHVNRNLSNLVKFPVFLFHSPFLPITSSLAHSQLATLQLLSMIRGMLYEVSEEIADFFSFPILLSVGCCFVAFVYNVYYIILPILMQDGDLSLNIIINPSLWIFSSIHSLAVLSFTVTKARKEAKLTGHIIHKLLILPMRQEFKTKLGEFSLQLLHEHSGFTACGFFKLDCTMLYSILGATATYLVILIQYQKSDGLLNVTPPVDSTGAV